MDAVEYIKEKVRMCHSDPVTKYTCNRCPFDADTNEIGCVYWEETDPAEAVRIVEEWSKAHPKQTNADKFREVFGKDPIEMYGDLKNDYGDWFFAPYVAPKGADNGE